MSLKVLDGLTGDFKLAMQPFLDQPMNAAFARSLAVELNKKFELDISATSVSVGAHCDGSVFDRKLRLQLATRLAYFAPRLAANNSPWPVGKFSEFSANEEIAVEIVGVVPVEDEKKPTVDLKILVKTGTPAGVVTPLNMSYGACARLSRILGYSFRRSYDTEMPWMLNYMQCSFVVRDNGPLLTAKDTKVNTYQKSINSEIISRRVDCPLDETFLCIDCPRRNGPFAPQTNYCEGAVRR
jgi:hypothetical protein